MSVIDEAATVGSSEEPAGPGPGADRPRRLRRRRQVLAASIVLIALLLLVSTLSGKVLGRHRASEPAAFARHASTGMMGRVDPAVPGERYTFGFAAGSLPDVEVRSAQVQISPSSVATASVVSICRAVPDRGADIVGAGTVVGDLSEWCAEVIPVDGQDLGRFGPDDDLIVTLVALAEGPVHVTGIRLAYDQGSRPVSEEVPVDLWVGLPD